MFLYYDVIDDKKVISVVSETKLDYLGNNFIEKEEVPEGRLLYLDDEDNILVEEETPSNLEEKIEYLERELKKYKAKQDEIDKDLDILAGGSDE
ncbi:hypothetical protein [uncultured Anaerococcus sp.]|uniref:hypothetical protein n=1 Tax=uncultured Anaerococcus sp. TaxID=293428 RepID=UPI0025ECDCBF|nr:hypothetical protein [uncultured Anaerococcus sp.]